MKYKQKNKKHKIKNKHFCIKEIYNLIKLDKYLYCVLK